MGYKKCPRCELNYIRDDQQLCDVCSRKRKASDDDNEVLMCIECGENPAMKGKELCAACYKESLRQERLGKQHKTIAALDEMDNSDMEDVGVPLDEAKFPKRKFRSLTAASTMTMKAILTKTAKTATIDSIALHPRIAPLLYRQQTD